MNTFIKTRLAFKIIVATNILRISPKGRVFRGYVFNNKKTHLTTKSGRGHGNRYSSIQNTDLLQNEKDPQVRHVSCLVKNSRDWLLMIEEMAQHG